MDKLLDIWQECQQHNGGLKPLEAPLLATDDSRFLWLKYQILMHVEDCLKTTEVRSQTRSIRKVRETKSFYITTNL